MLIRPKNRRIDAARRRRRAAAVVALVSLALASVWGLSAAVSAERASQPLTAEVLQSQSPCVQAQLRKALVDRLEPLRQSDLATVQELCSASDIAKDQLLVLIHETSTDQVVDR
jgi:hypothetical protein